MTALGGSSSRRSTSSTSPTDGGPETAPTETATAALRGGFFMPGVRMQNDFETARSFVVKEEGGYVDDPQDSGNWSSGTAGVGTLIGSNEGVGAPAAISFMRRMVTRAWMKALPDDVHRAMFRLYWNRVGGDAMPAGLDLMLIDSGWNRGTGTAVQILQRVLSLEADGKPGPATVAAAIRPGPRPLRIGILDVAALQAALGLEADGVAGPVTLAAWAQLGPAEALLVALYAAQVRDYRSLRQFSRYGRGWLARTARRLAAARAMVAAAPVAAAA
ncbi:glycosyl hydrolase 108 family protein [Rhizosaccharibacter radicis]|uniref:TtsA-like Glycoside hydrolase family 108 domain-containing protein n=1 Tax=Rhizosaccharibacter radicis TaxID=2782605 RepID=A0ABT1VWD0_9PROT|nr:hypothetical protein [Acetobacteraceae bacterium KSS12]